MTVPEENLRGCDAPSLLVASREEKRILLTFDSDFGDIRAYPPAMYSGIVVFRLVDQRWEHLKGPARQLIDSGVLERFSGGRAVVDETRGRIRSGSGGTSSYPFS